MKVKDLMSVDPACCSPETDLAAASALMWNHDCGILPVLEEGRVVGVVTDRDICIALGTRGLPASQVQVGDVASRELVTVSPEAEVHTALAQMRRHQVRRLPVVNAEGYLEGLLALNDFVLAVDRKHGDVDYEDVLNTLKAISSHRHKPAVRESAPKAAAAVA